MGPASTLSDASSIVEQGHEQIVCPMSSPYAPAVVRLPCAKRYGDLMHGREPRLPVHLLQLVYRCSCFAMR